MSKPIGFCFRPIMLSSWWNSAKASFSESIALYVLSILCVPWCGWVCAVMRRDTASQLRSACVWYFVIFSLFFWVYLLKVFAVQVLLLVLLCLSYSAPPHVHLRIDFLLRIKFFSCMGLAIRAIGFWLLRIYLKEIPMKVPEGKLILYDY